MPNDKLKDFVTNNIRWDRLTDEIRDDEMVTEAFVVYRVVRVTDDNEFLPERVDAVTSHGASFVMARGMLSLVDSKWECELAKKLYEDLDQEDEDNGEGDESV